MRMIDRHAIIKNHLLSNDHFPREKSDKEHEYRRNRYRLEIHLKSKTCFAPLDEFAHGVVIIRNSLSDGESKIVLPFPKRGDGNIRLLSDVFFMLSAKLAYDETLSTEEAPITERGILFSKEIAQLKTERRCESKSILKDLYYTLKDQYEEASGEAYAKAKDFFMDVQEIFFLICYQGLQDFTTDHVWVLNAEAISDVRVFATGMNPATAKEDAKKLNADDIRALFGKYFDKCLVSGRDERVLFVEGIQNQPGIAKNKERLANLVTDDMRETLPNTKDVVPATVKENTTFFPEEGIKHSHNEAHLSKIIPVFLLALGFLLALVLIGRVENKTIRSNLEKSRRLADMLKMEWAPKPEEEKGLVLTFITKEYKDEGFQYKKWNDEWMATRDKLSATLGRNLDDLAPSEFEEIRGG